MTWNRVPNCEVRPGDGMPSRENVRQMRSYLELSGSRQTKPRGTSARAVRFCVALPEHGSARRMCAQSMKRSVLQDLPDMCRSRISLSAAISLRLNELSCKRTVYLCSPWGAFYRILVTCLQLNRAAQVYGVLQAAHLVGTCHRTDHAI
jgi:hypothetical protein